jgi:integrase
MASRRSHGEGSIFFEAARNRWIGTVDLGLDGTGKRRRAKVTGRTKSQARDKLRAVQRQAEAGLPIGDGGLTFGAFLDRWLADVLPARSRVRSSNTVENYRWAVERHLKPALGAKRLRALTPEDVEGVLRRLAADGMAQNSVMRVRSVAVMALKHAQRRDLIARNAAELAEMPAGAKAPEEGRSLTVEQAARLLTVAEDDPVGPLVVVGLMLGLRPGELCGLRWSDIDLEGRTLHDRQARKRERGPDGREVLRFGEPKTAKSRRSLAMPAPVVTALQRQRAQQARERLVVGAAWQDLDLVFANGIGAPLDPSNLRRVFGRLTERAGLGRWHPNELRHSACSLLSAAGVPLEDVADILGHDGTRMAARFYRHAVAPSVGAAVGPMEAMFGAPS